MDTFALECFKGWLMIVGLFFLAALLLIYIHHCYRMSQIEADDRNWRKRRMQEMIDKL